MTRFPGGALLLCLWAGIGGGCTTVPSLPAVYERTTPKSVPETLADVEFAVTERNFRITGQLHVGKGIRERDRIGFPEYEVVLFCNLGLARRMLELDPGFINYCPGRVAVRDTGGMTHISAPLLPESPDQGPELAALVRRINGLVREIVDYGTEPWSGHRP